MINPLQLPQVTQGIPYFDLWVILIIAGVAVAWFFFRSSVQGVPVIVKWVYRNGTAIELKAKEDLQGIFLEILNAKGKVIETIKKTGIPLEVQEINEKDSRAYLVKFSDGSKRVFLSVALSRMKHKREYTVLEGTGETVDLMDKGRKMGSLPSTSIPMLTEAALLLRDGAGDSAEDKQIRVKSANGLESIVKQISEGPQIGGLGNSVTLHEERSAAKAFMKDLAEALAGTFKALILPMIAGGGMTASAIIIVLLLSGHLH